MQRLTQEDYYYFLFFLKDWLISISRVAAIIIVNEGTESSKECITSENIWEYAKETNVTQTLTQQIMNKLTYNDRKCEKK